MRRTLAGTLTCAVALAIGAAPASAIVVTPDGDAILFSTTEPLTAADTDTKSDAYLRTSSGLELVSPSPGTGTPEHVGARALSPAGDRAIFETKEPLAADDTDATEDLYAWEGGALTLLTTGPADVGGEPYGFGETWVSPDTTRVVFEADQPLAAADTDSSQDLYLRAGGVTTLLTPGRSGPSSAYTYVFGGASDDASRVFAETDEPLVSEDGDSAWDVYELSGGTPKLVTKGSLSPLVSANARFRDATPDGTAVVFETKDTLVVGDLNDDPRLDYDGTDLYLRAGGTTRLVTADERGLSRPCPHENTGWGPPPCTPSLPSISDDGAHVLFMIATPLARGDTDNSEDVYRRTGAVPTVISTGPSASSGGTLGSYFASTDGLRVSFDYGYGRLTSNDTDGQRDSYHRAGTTTTLLSIGPSGGNGPHYTALAAMSADGSHSAFWTKEALTAADGDAGGDIYVHGPGGVELLTTGPTDPQSSAGLSHSSANVVMSADGEEVVFATDEALVAEDTDAAGDVYLRSGGTTTLVSG